MYWTFSLKSCMTWGKHKGKTVQWIVDNDTDYLEWCCLNIHNISFRFKAEFEKAFKDKKGYTLQSIREKHKTPKQKII